MVCVSPQRMLNFTLWMNEWCIYIAVLLCIVVHPKRFTIMWGGLTSTTTSVQHPLGWCDGCHRTKAPVRSPHTSYRWRRESHRANQVDGDYYEAMIDKSQWGEFGQDTGDTPLLFTRSALGFLMTTESQEQMDMLNHVYPCYHFIQCEMA